MKTLPASIEWAHVSNQTYPNVMISRLSEAQESETLVRLHFSNFIKPQLFKIECQTCENDESFVLGNFVLEDLKHSDPCRSKISMEILLDIEKTEHSGRDVHESDQFKENCDEVHLKFFHVESQA